MDDIDFANSRLSTKVVNHSYTCSMVLDTIEVFGNWMWLCDVACGARQKSI